MLSRQLRFFAAIAEHGSIVRAAAALRIAQPALSRQLRQLELEVGTPLLVREWHGVRLTPAGVALLDAAHALFAHFERALRHAYEARDGVRGVLRVGLGRIAVEHPAIGRAIAAARAEFPDIRLDVRELPSPAQPAALRTRDVDLAIGAVHFDGNGALDSELLHDDVVDTAVVPATHPLAMAASVDLSELFALRHLTLDTSLGSFPEVLDALKRAGMTDFERRASIESLYHLVAAGRGWTVAPHCMRVHPPVGTRMIAIRDLRVAVPIFVGWRVEDGSRAVSNIVRRLLGEMGRPSAAQARVAPAREEHAVPDFQRLASGIELEQLQTLTAAIDDRSLSRAAARLNLSQSGVSRRLDSLERQTGLALAKRLPHGIVGTAAGYALRAEVAGLQRLAQGAVESARRAAAGLTESYRIGTLPIELVGERLLQPLRQLQQRMPHVALEVTEMTSEQLHRALRERAIDIALSTRVQGLSIDPELASVQLDDDVLDCALVAASHSLAEKSWVTVAELAQAPFVFISSDVSPRFHEAVMRAFEAIGLTPALGASCGGIRTMWRTTADSMAWTIGRRSQRSNPPAGMVAVPVEGLHLPAPTVLLWRRDNTSTAFRNVLDVFREQRGPGTTPPPAMKARAEA